VGNDARVPVALEEQDAGAEGDIEAMAMYAGESAGLVDAIVPAAEVVASTVRQAEDLLRAARRDPSAHPLRRCAERGSVPDGRGS